MTAISVDRKQARAASVGVASVWGGVRNVGLAAVGAAARAEVLLERLFTLVVLGLMVVAGVVISVVTVGVLTGFID